MNDNPYQHPSWAVPGNRIREIGCKSNTAVITKLTDLGFMYAYDNPKSVSGSKKLCRGGEVFLDKVGRYGHTLFEGLGGQESLVWGERMWGP